MGLFVVLAKHSCSYLRLSPEGQWPCPREGVAFSVSCLAKVCPSVCLVAKVLFLPVSYPVSDQFLCVLSHKGVSLSGDTGPCKGTPVILHGVVSPDLPCVVSRKLSSITCRKPSTRHAWWVSNTGREQEEAAGREISLLTTCWSESTASSR